MGFKVGDTVLWDSRWYTNEGVFTAEIKDIDDEGYLTVCDSEGYYTSEINPEDIADIDHPYTHFLTRFYNKS